MKRKGPKSHVEFVHKDVNNKKVEVMMSLLRFHPYEILYEFLN